MPKSRGGALWRFALAGVIVIAFTAATTAVAGLLQFKQAAAEIALTPALKHARITIANPSDPQTILIIGSDHRAGTSWNSANTDTMMLVRLDPNSSTINVLSVPRDLQVQLPEGGGVATAKLNAAYSIGGPNLLIKTLQQQVFPNLKVNHIIDINFGGFEALVDAIGCVYTDVDHRYYNDTAVTDYSSIDIQPGYQKLCDAGALEFVRFRHTDSDIVRNARQQDFIRWAKDQYGLSQLLANKDTLLRIFGEHAQTDGDLHTTDGLLKLFNLVAFSDGHAIKQIPFPAILLPCPPDAGTGNVQPCYVTGEAGAEQHAFNQFMTRTTVQQASPASGSGGTGGASGGGGGSGGGSGAGASASAGGESASSGLTADPADGQSQAAALPGIGLPVYYPRLIAADSRYCTNDSCAIGPVPNSYPRYYEIHDESGNAYDSYRMTLAVDPAVGQYYGVQGTTWQDPPILRSPTETRTVGAKKLLLFFNGHKLSLAAWRTPRAVYWVSNTLTDDIPNQQLIAIGASLTPAH